MSEMWEEPTRECLTNSGACFGCANPNHRLRDCPSYIGRGKDAPR